MTRAALEAIEEDDGELLLMEPREQFDKCVVGIGQRFTSRFVVYDRACVLRVLGEDMSAEDAEEYFDFNVIGAWVGEATPAFLETIKGD